MIDSPVGVKISEQDFDAVARQVRAAGSSFYWAMRLVDSNRRAALYAIYSFCRDVDDIADGEMARADRKTALAAWRSRIDRLYAGGPDTDSLDRLLIAAIGRYGLKKDDFLGVIDGMEMDADGPLRAPDLETLDLYCDRVASAVGRLCVRVFGAESEAGIRLANHQGRALQLTNIIRDVEEDAAMGRLYLPRPLLAAEGIAALDPADVLRHPGLPAVKRALAAMAEREFAEARAALACCKSGDMRPALIMMDVYERIFRDLTARDFAPARQSWLSKKLSKFGKIMLALRVALWRR